MMDALDDLLLAELLSHIDCLATLNQLDAHLQAGQEAGPDQAHPSHVAAAPEAWPSL
jgi:hypothetical protein